MNPLKREHQINFAHTNHTGCRSACLIKFPPNSVLYLDFSFMKLLGVWTEVTRPKHLTPSLVPELRIVSGCIFLLIFETGGWWLNSSLSTFMCVPHALVRANWNKKCPHVSMFVCIVQYWTKSRPTNKCVKNLHSNHSQQNIQIPTQQQNRTTAVNNRQRIQQRWSVEKNLKTLTNQRKFGFQSN